MKENDFIEMAVDHLINFKGAYCYNSDISEGELFRCKECMFNDNPFCYVNKFISEHGTERQNNRARDLVWKGFTK